jgi:hypothetical protein
VPVFIKKPTLQEMGGKIDYCLNAKKTDGGRIKKVNSAVIAEMPVPGGEIPLGQWNYKYPVFLPQNVKLKSGCATSFHLILITLDYNAVL